MTLPNFLIIGAMKAGTTTVYEDLRAAPEVYFPPEKEPNDLVDPLIASAGRLERYSKKFAGSKGADVIGEASTAYTKRPLYEGVARRAVDVLGGDLRILYMVREPIARMVSQYHHEVGAGRAKDSINSVLLADPTYVAFSRYAYQLEPWQKVLPSNQILVMSFERYVADKTSELSRIHAFLGLNPPITFDEVHRNASSSKSVVPEKGVWRSVMRSQAYQYGLKRLLSTSTREAIKRIVLPKAPRAIESLTDDTRRELMSRLSVDDVALYDATHAAPSFAEGAFQ